MKRILSWILALTLLLGVVPVGVVQGFAAELQPQEQTEQVVETTEATVSEVEETTAPVEETTAPAEETTAAPEETVAPAEEPAATVPETVPETEEVASEKAEFSQPERRVPNDELFTGYAMSMFYSREAAYSIKAGARLSGDEKTIYNALVPVIQDIAAGRQSSTIIYIGKTVYFDGEYMYPDVSATFKSKSISNAGLSRIVNALLADLPYDFYWYDKVTGCTCQSIYNTSTNKMIQFQIAFVVADNYWTSNYFSVNTTLAKRAAASAANSKAIIEKYKNESDYGKLVGYKEEICNLVEYDFDAVYYGDFSEDNDPWQLIHVFDGDPTTNVVCEGYSKAYMYLCEQSKFTGKTSCVLATGDMGGAHMWNIVQMGGKNYLVDITNSDGWDDRFFLAGGSGSVANGYTIAGYKYTYDTDTKNTWGTGSSSVLTLSSTYFNPYKDLAPTVSASNGMLSFGSYLDGFVYQIYRSTSKSGTYKLVDEIWAEACQWEDLNCTAGKTYYYKAKAVSNDGRYSSVYSSVVSISVRYAAPVVTANPGSTGKPVVKWNKVSGAKKYEVWRSVDDAAFKKLATVTKTTYTDSKATAGTKCTYKVKALASKSTYNSVFGDSDYCYVTCAAPSLTVKLDTSTGKPSLSWSKVTGAVNYDIYRSVNGGEYEFLTNVSGTSYKDTETRADNKYSYQMMTIGKGEMYNSVLSAAKSVVVTVGKPKLTGTINDNGKPVITWAAVEDVVEYKVYRSTKSNKGFSLVKTIAAAEELSYTDTSVAAGKTYYYKVLAVGQNSTNYSSYIKLTGKCDIPDLFVKNNAAGKPVLTWNKISGAKKYEIYRSVNDGAFKKLTTVTKTTYTDTKATTGAECTYKVRALGSKSTYNGQFSEEFSCDVILPVPTVTAKVDAATGRPTITWKAVSGAAGYEVRRIRNSTGEEASRVYEKVYVVYDDSAILGEAYTYTVTALGVDPVFDSAESKGYTMTPTIAQPKVKGKINAAGKPELTWGEVENATGYIVYRSTSSSKGFTKVGVMTEGELTFADNSAKKGKTYYYKVVAVYGDLPSAQSSAVKLKAKK